MRVCQFRHDGKWTYIAAATLKPPYQEDLPNHSTDTKRCVKLLKQRQERRTTTSSSAKSFPYIRSCNSTETVSPSSLPIAFRTSALTGNLWVPSPIAMKELWNG
jgi:hypothetical protein